MQRTVDIVGRKTDKSLPSQSSQSSRRPIIKEAILPTHDVFRKGITVGTQISDSSSGITETCRLRKKYSKECGKRLFTRKERAEREKMMAHLRQ